MTKGAANTTPKIKATSRSNENASPGFVKISELPGGSDRSVGPSTKLARRSTKAHATSIPSPIAMHDRMMRVRSSSR